ncbi:IS66 family insertion sequence element accessory protein TnpB [Methylibium sp.]|uniref:IS66 family insertion sequence element accessory protein TnpB n=1 Tax=Methylibium sp. TaxID=2067992 RepID=UPI00286A87A0|nr:IS66 family insertion sequence element accessory protein TnpB [Methylibium sp.]
MWCAARRLNAGRFVWPRDMAPGAAPMTLTQLQFDALVLGLPWQRLEHMRVISRM